MSATNKSALAERQIRRTQLRISEEEAHLDRLIVQGFPTQALVDALRKMKAALRVLQHQRRNASQNLNFPAAPSGTAKGLAFYLDPA